MVLLVEQAADRSIELLMAYLEAAALGGLDRHEVQSLWAEAAARLDRGQAEPLLPLPNG